MKYIKLTINNYICIINMIFIPKINEMSLNLYVVALINLYQFILNEYEYKI